MCFPPFRSALFTSTNLTLGTSFCHSSQNSQRIASITLDFSRCHILLRLQMAPPTTALLLIDPYNDFLHPKGKAYPALAESLHHTQTIPHLLSLVKTVRNAQIPIFYCLHQQSHPDQYKDWQFMTKSQHGLEKRKVFEEGSWGAQIFEGLEPDPKNGDVVVAKHWNSRLESFYSRRAFDLCVTMLIKGCTKLIP
jgi:isochorismate hydrolase